MSDNTKSAVKTVIGVVLVLGIVYYRHLRTERRFKEFTEVAEEVNRRHEEKEKSQISPAPNSQTAQAPTVSSSPLTGNPAAPEPTAPPGADKLKDWLAHADSKNPRFENLGGTLTLTVAARQIPIHLDSALATPTDAHLSGIASLALIGPQTRITFSGVQKGSGSGAPYVLSTLLNQPLPLQTGASPSAINVPGMGVYPVTSATLNLDLLQVGQEGKALCSGRLNLLFVTTQGKIPLQGHLASVFTLATN